MNDRRYYSDYDGRYLGGIRKENVKLPRTMRQIKDDYNKNLQKHSLSKVNKRK